MASTIGFPFLASPKSRFPSRAICGTSSGLPAQFTWTNGGAVSAHIPVRYPATEEADDDALRLARKTVWNEAGSECYHGLGQRVLATDAGEYPLLDCRVIELTAAP